MAKVTNLNIKLQTGTTSSYYASWDFNETTTTVTSSGIKAGTLVSIKSGATYYNGVAIPSWVMNQKWYVKSVSGDRAVLGKNVSGSNNINSPINTKYLTGGTSSTTTTTTTNYLDHYEVKWYYDSGDSMWFEGSGTSNTTEKNHIYSAPSNAIRIRVSVKPVSKNKTVDGSKETPYWTGDTVTKDFDIDVNTPEKAPTPDVKIEKYQLTASLENISDQKADEIRFEVYNGTTVVNIGDVAVVTRRASFVCTVAAGGEYRVRCCALNINGTTRVEGEWSDYSSSVTTIPSTPSNITSIKASSETSVYLEWTEVSNAESYDIEYTTKVTYFDTSNQTTVQSGIETNKYDLYGLESGSEYFFRVRAVNNNGTSGWSEPKSVIIGKAPAAPTTWSSTTTCVVGETLNLYWVHNSEDGSSQTKGELELYVNGTKYVHTIQNSTEEDEKDKTSVYAVNTGEYYEGTVLQWRVRTAGVTGVYGEWSIQRTVDIYAPPTLTLSVTDANATPINILRSFPFYVRGTAGPNTQTPIGYHVSIVSNDTYETVDSVGNKKIISNGEEVYSKYFNSNSDLLVIFSADNVDLQNNINYTVKCLVSMNSGLTAESYTKFMVVWTDEEYEPDAEITINKESLVAYIRPYCKDINDELVEDVTVSVYRREFNGDFTEIAKNINNLQNTLVTDPHPSLDYARYRIVATSKTTGAVSYYDAPGYPVACKSVIIQWDEEWVNFDTVNEDKMATSPWVGSMLNLPYNIDVTDNHQNDVALIKYIGRSNPTSYYGTQRGKTAVWNTEIPKSDKDTLYALRRLADWMGDVYVREPSGSGYWANISVSFSQKHKQLTIPVTLDITRVEGGI